MFIIDINPSLAYIQMKGKFSCPICGPKMKSHHSTSLGKEVFDEYRNFPSKNHDRYRASEKHIFNGKEEIELKPWRMKPDLWKLEYNRNLHEGHDGLPWGMKSFPTQFMRFPYYEKLAHLFHTMHLYKNGSKNLWWIVDGRRDKEKTLKRCNDIMETNHVGYSQMMKTEAMFHGY